MKRFLQWGLKLKGLLMGLDWTFARYYPATQYYEARYVPKEERKRMRWAHRHGFFYERIEEYGMTPANCKHYLSDLDYYKLHPVNLVASSWMDDKLTVRYVLQPFADIFPSYYFHINICGENLRIFEGAAEKKNPFGVTIDEVISFMQQKKVIVKGRMGSRSKGVYSVEYAGGYWLVNKKMQTTAQLKEKLLESEDAIIQEFINPHAGLPDGFEKLRLILFRDWNKGPQIGAAYIDLDCGEEYTEESPYYVDILCKVDITTGHYDTPRKIRTSKPDCEQNQTGRLNTKKSMQLAERIEGDLPFWDVVVAKMKEIFAYAPQILYFGADVIITDNGFKLLELNSLPDLEAQMFYPFLAEESALASFFRSRKNS